MHLSKINDAMAHRITGGSEHLWDCYPNARYMDYESDYAEASAIFDTVNQSIYAAVISSKDESKRPYRWLNTAYKDEYYAEALKRQVDPDQACDDVKWIDLETEEDFLEKATAIFNNQEYDDRVTITLDLDDDLILQLALEAHKRDITINKMVEIILLQAIELHEHKLDWESAQHGWRR